MLNRILLGIFLDLRERAVETRTRMRAGDYDMVCSLCGRRVRVIIPQDDDVSEFEFFERIGMARNGDGNLVCLGSCSSAMEGVIRNLSKEIAR
jgi:hypothetical protein